MKTLFALTLLASAGAAFAGESPLPNGELLREFPWTIGDTQIPVDIHSPAPFTFFTPGPATKIGWEEIAKAPGTYAIQIAYPGKIPYQFQLISLGRDMIAPIVTKQYAMVGEVKYEDVAAGSYLEMWSNFASPGPGYPPQSYFSRTLAKQGPMGQLRGTSDWRTFQLPFDASGTTSELQSLVVNLLLTGPGVVHVRGLKLFQYPNSVSAALPLMQPPDGQASSQQEQVVANFSPEQSSAALQPPLDGEIGAWSISGGGSVWTLANPPVTASKYAITGEIRYSGVSVGLLEMASDYAPEQPGGVPPFFVTRAQDSSGVMGRLYGTSDWRTFWLPFDASERKSRLTDLVLNLVLADPGNPASHVSVRNIRLVQYPTGAFPVSMTPSGKIPEPQRGPVATNSMSVATQPSTAPSWIDLRSFLLGIASVVLTLILSGGCVLLFRRWHQWRKECEMRRMASLDG